MKYTRFMDMYSGGSAKEDKFEYCYIEAPKEEAVMVFYHRFGHNPFRVSCTCCGEDYSVREVDAIEVDDEENKTLIITAAEIKPEERVGELSEQGYIWHE